MTKRRETICTKARPDKRAAIHRVREVETIRRDRRGRVTVSVTRACDYCGGEWDMTGRELKKERSP